MPSSGTSKHPQRCQYKEGKRRCVRNAVDGSNPALCNTHRVMFADVGRQQTSGRVPGKMGGVLEVLTDLLSGERVSRSRVEAAVNDLFQGAWDLGGFMAQGYSPTIPHQDPGIDWDNLDGSNPNAQQRQQARGPRPPPGYRYVDEEAIQLREARRRARVVLGFAESVPITADELKRTYRTLVTKHHPDHASGEADRRAREEKTRMINAARDILQAEIEAR